MLYHTSQFISNLLLSNGVNALKDGRISKGLQWTEKALTRSPTNTDAYAFLSNISYSLEEYEDALALLTHTIELSPKDYQPYVSR
ncbi:MAG: hypothetical protein LBU27_07785 [Candidatus Peribacteria bacterium]|jgi:tetratricopeptide (TPR) repeat protein|nr:hypothetical protein [Candidatus Peribacteria bacterium]